MTTKNETNKAVKDVAAEDYKYGWVTEIEEDTAPPGLTAAKISGSFSAERSIHLA